MTGAFTVTIKNPEKRFAEGKAALKNLGARFEGDIKNGTVSGTSPLGSIMANYSALGNDLYRIEILEKPFFVPISVIEQKVREAIG